MHQNAALQPDEQVRLHSSLADVLCSMTSSRVCVWIQGPHEDRSVPREQADTDLPELLLWQGSRVDGRQHQPSGVALRRDPPRPQVLGHRQAGGRRTGTGAY